MKTTASSLLLIALLFPAPVTLAQTEQAGSAESDVITIESLDPDGAGETDTTGSESGVEAAPTRSMAGPMPQAVRPVRPPKAPRPPKPKRPSAGPGTVAGHTFGVQLRAVAGDAEWKQSQWGAMLHYVLPTTGHSHLRFRLGMPMWRSDEQLAGDGKDYPIPLVAAEHEWGWERIGVNAGLSFSYVEGRRKRYHDSGGSGERTVTFDDAYNANLILGVRAGRSDNGFRGRIALPFNAYAVGAGEYLRSYFLEGSALYVRTIRSVRFGIGAEGMITEQRKRLDDVYDYYGYYTHKDVGVTAHYIVAPCAKLAIRIGEKHVLLAGLDLLGTIFRPLTVVASGTNDIPPPVISLGYVFSLSPLPAPGAYDGSF